MAGIIRMYDEERRGKVNRLLATCTIEDVLNLTLEGNYCGYVIEDGIVTGVEQYE